MTGTISTADLKALMESGDEFTLIDVRERTELENGMLPNSVNLPLSQFGLAFKMGELEFAKEYGFDLPRKNLVVVYCRTGNRSQKAAEVLEKAGFYVKNYKGSVLEWSKVDEDVKFY